MSWQEVWTFLQWTGLSSLTLLFLCMVWVCGCGCAPAYLLACQRINLVKVNVCVCSVQLLVGIWIDSSISYSAAVLRVCNKQKINIYTQHSTAMYNESFTIVQLSTPTLCDPLPVSMVTMEMTYCTFTHHVQMRATKSPWMGL